MTDFDALSNALIDQVKLELEEASHNVEGDIYQCKTYIAERMQHLATLATLPGFDEAVKAERDAIAIALATASTIRADRFDEKILALLRGALGMVARAAIMA